MHELRKIRNQYNLGSVSSSNFKEGVKSITLYKNHECVGKISIYRTSFEIINTIKDEEIQPIITLIEDIMKTGSPAIVARGRKLIDNLK